MARASFVSLIILIISLAYQVNVYAGNPSYFEDHGRGWHWYEKQDTSSDEDDSKESDPIEKMSVIQATVKRALDKAVLEPTKENVKSYIEIQNQVAQRSAKFAELWKEALLENPQLDFTLRHPINNLARQVEADQDTRQEEEAIRRLAAKSGLFFFYRSTCPYCKAFAPILKRFVDHYGISIIAITTDGIILPEFPDSVVDKGQKALFDIKVEPAVFTVNPYTHKAVPVGYGLMSEADLKKSILKISTSQVGE